MCLDNKMPIFTPYFRQQYRDKKINRSTWYKGKNNKTLIKSAFWKVFNSGIKLVLM